MSLFKYLTHFFLKRWYGRPGLLFGLYPLEKLYALLAAKQKQKHSEVAYLSSVPTLVIGNITVGGTGKTPFIIALANYLVAQGLKPAVISRGYGRQDDGLHTVEQSHSPDQVGDEPLLIASQCPCPVIVAVSRVQAVKYVERVFPECNVILSDDGLQHYALARHFELIMVDGLRFWGNRHLLPVGPLREPLSRVSSVDWLVVNGELSQSAEGLGDFKRDAHVIALKPLFIVNVKTGEKRDLQGLAQWPDFVAMAGIGNPERFFLTLKSLGCRQFSEVPLPDHFRFQPQDFEAFGSETVVMTHKDAVKCAGFSRASWWYLEVGFDTAASPLFAEIAATLQQVQVRSARH